MSKVVLFIQEEVVLGFVEREEMTGSTGLGALSASAVVAALAGLEGASQLSAVLCDSQGAVLWVCGCPHGFPPGQNRFVGMCWAPL